MNEVLIKEESEIKNMIYEIRGKQVMIDSDLAILYQCKNGTKEINQAVKNNVEKFPERYAFRITEEEYNSLKSKNLTSKTRGGSRKGHNVFTEQGVAMLATILKTPVATQVSIGIMDAFVEMRKYISSNLLEQQYINKLVLEDHENIKLLQESFNKMNNVKSYDGLFFKDQIYDSYSLVLDILNQAKSKIIIIDNYIDKNILDILRKINKEILIVTNKYNNEDYNKYKAQYKNITLKIDNNIHDRFIIIDNNKLYHSGASFKDLGKKCFAITEIENKKWLKEILDCINNI